METLLMEILLMEILLMETLLMETLWLGENTGWAHGQNTLRGYRISRQLGASKAFLNDADE